MWNIVKDIFLSLESILIFKLNWIVIKNYSQIHFTLVNIILCWQDKDKIYLMCLIIPIRKLMISKKKNSKDRPALNRIIPENTITTWRSIFLFWDLQFLIC